MVKLALLALLAGCEIASEFTCAEDADCDLGQAGKCEDNHRCTIAGGDASCLSGRVFAPHSGELSGTCVPEERDPLNACAEGQPPALGETACTAAVCAKLPACCSTGWSSACVQQAQLVCEDVVCDTRLAITATRTSTTELWTTTFDGTTWTQPESHIGNSLSWFAPEREVTEPRLGVFSGGTTPPIGPSTLTIDGVDHVLTDRTYAQAASLDMTRNGHDVLLLGSSVTYATGDARNGQYFETYDLDTGERHEFKRPNAIRTVVGDLDHDAFPDIAVTNNTGRYEVLANDFPTPDSTSREMISAGGAITTGDPTPGMGLETRSIEWADLDDNGFLDLLVSGLSTRIHLATPRINPQVATTTIDCNPPSTQVGQCDTAASSFVSTARATRDGTKLLLAPFPQRTIYELYLPDGPRSAIAIPMASCGAACALRWVAIAARDLDGDHILDVIAIDENLNVFTSRSTLGGMLELALQIPTERDSVTNVRLVVTGAPR